MLKIAAIALLAAAAGPASPVDALSGRYDRSFPNATVDGERYTGEDIVEIVRVTPDAAYVRASLSFFNGHSCGIAGVARVQGKRLVYRERASPDGGQCTLTIERAGRSLRLDDGGGACKDHCGARGSFTDHDLPFASRRPIRYMTRLKASTQYRQALAQWRRR